MYIEFVNFLHSVGLQPNLAKVQEGRFSTGVLDFCGYRFAGGYVTVSPPKITLFKNAIATYCAGIVQSKKIFSERAFVKNLNQKINGFGHYYKYGNVAHTFDKLDGFIRHQIRTLYKKLQLTTPSNAHLQSVGLRSLAHLKKQKKQTLISHKAYADISAVHRHKTPTKNTALNTVYLGYLEQLVHQNTEIIQQLKKINKSIASLGAVWQL